VLFRSGDDLVGIVPRSVPTASLEDAIRERFASARLESQASTSGQAESLAVLLDAIEDSLLALARVIEVAFHSIGVREQEEHT